MSSGTGHQAHKKPLAAESVTANTSSTYPTADLRASVAGRRKRALGDVFGLTKFGVNHTTLAPGAASALQHHHGTQDEFVYILQGTATLQLDDEEIPMKAGDCMGFPAGDGVAHCLVNTGDEPVVYLEMGDRSSGDVVEYRDADLRAVSDDDGRFQFVHRDGSPYDKDDDV